MLRSAPKVLADITTFSWISLLQKFGLDLFLLHVGHCFLVTFHVCLLRFPATVQVTLLLLARLERSRTPKRPMCGSRLHLLDSECMMDISAGMETIY